MHRNLPLVILGVAFLVSLRSAAAIQTAPPETSTNVLVIMTDEHNFRTLGCYRETMEKRQAYMWGEAVVETPNIDWLAKNGTLCTSFYATTPVCSPSRACLISGKYPQATPVVNNNIPLSDDVISFAEVLKKKGYQTGFAGKWHLDGTGKPQWAPKRKFGFEDNRYMFNRGHWKKLELTPDGPQVASRNGRRPSYGVEDADEETFTTDFLTNRALEFIETNKDSSFCYMLSFPDPHGPDTVRAPYDTMFADQGYERPQSADKPGDDLPSWGKKTNGSFAQDQYYGMIRCIDDNVGRILEKLKSEGLMENTIIVFTADHGDLRGEHHRQNKGVPY
ncbi:sulfatase-like hydrolase/transferase, partial [bacterium]|nr:sulfatase-like hydrolase/transferase [bacterium]